MPSRIATFEKVSFEQFKRDCEDRGMEWPEYAIRTVYDNIRMPMRSTSGSAGYDIFAPTNINLRHGETIVIPTGLRCKIDEGWFLDLNPRSGNGFKYGIHLANTRGIIDSDYYGSDNEGHIMIKLVNDAPWSNKDFIVEAGTGFAQGIFTIYGITTNDDASNIRTGGFGSTDHP